MKAPVRSQRSPDSTRQGTAADGAHQVAEVHGHDPTGTAL